MNPDDTIAAVSSPPGMAERGVVRLSGPDSFRIASTFFEPDPIKESHAFPAWRSGMLRLDVGRLPCAVYLFRAPASYTGQDIAEIHVIGSPVLLGVIVEACLAAGARRAEAGEFTARAFLAGKLDLSQVHAVAGMIAARSDHQLEAAERLLHGALSQRATQAREELADLISLVEGAMDFADEPIEFITPGELRRRLGAIREMLHSTTQAGARAERWGALPRVLLAGAPNAGKSSLLNRLTGMDRVICSPAAGTTRDVVSAPMRLGEDECLLVDTAGLEDASNNLDALAQRASREALRDADLILHVVDAHVALTGADFSKPFDTLSKLHSTKRIAHLARADVPTLIAVNKCDLLDASIHEKLLSEASRSASSILPISAATGRGCDLLKDRMLVALQDRAFDRRDAAIALMAEHRESLDKAVDALDRAIELASEPTLNTAAHLVAGEPCSELGNADLVAAELRIAAEELGTLVGRDQTEEMLGRIFARFCVGK